MKTLLIILSVSGTINCFAGDSYVRGHMRRDGTYVQGHRRTTQDNSVNNNYGTRGNLNPYTGRSGKEKRKDHEPYGSYNSGNGLGGYGYDNNDDSDE